MGVIVLFVLICGLLIINKIVNTLMKSHSKLKKNLVVLGICILPFVDGLMGEGYIRLLQWADTESVVYKKETNKKVLEDYWYEHQFAQEMRLSNNKVIASLPKRKQWPYKMDVVDIVRREQGKYRKVHLRPYVYMKNKDTYFVKYLNTCKYYNSNCQRENFAIKRDGLKHVSLLPKEKSRYTLKEKIEKNTFLGIDMYKITQTLEHNKTQEVYYKRSRYESGRAMVLRFWRNSVIGVPAEIGFKGEFKSVKGEDKNLDIEEIAFPKSEYLKSLDKKNSVLFKQDGFFRYQ